MRLGYACVNTQLPSSARTTRLANATSERLLELTEANLDALAAILRWNREHDIDVFRISSDVVPFGSHPVNALPWDELLRDRFDELAGLADGMQLSMHPGQYTLLGSPHDHVNAAGLADLEYHARLLRALGLETKHRVVIHLGGAYGDRTAALERIRANVERLSDDARARLVLENDERWTLDETLAFARSVAAPVVFDVFHHELNPSFAGVSTRELVLLVRETWDGPQEVHFSTQEPGKRPGAHSATLDPEAFRRYADEVGDLDVDCILEVKDKEQSLLRARALSATRASA